MVAESVVTTADSSKLDSKEAIYQSYVSRLSSINATSSTKKVTTNKTVKDRKSKAESALEKFKTDLDNEDLTAMEASQNTADESSSFYSYLTSIEKANVDAFNEYAGL